MTICDLILLPLSSGLRHLKKGKKGGNEDEEWREDWEGTEEGKRRNIYPFANIFIIGSVFICYYIDYSIVFIYELPEIHIDFNSILNIWIFIIKSWCEIHW